MSKFLVPIKRSESGVPIILVPSAGTTVLSLVRLARSLKSPRPVYAFELTELPNGEALPASIEELADRCIDEIRSARLMGSCTVGGHCWGGIIAFEIAVRLEAEGHQVANLILLDVLSPPHGMDTGGDMLTIQAETAKAVSDLLGQIRENLARLPADQAQRFGSLSQALIEMALRYRANRAVRAPLLLIRTPAHHETVFQGWRALSTNGLTTRLVPGKTFSMLANPVVETVSSFVDEELRRHS